MLAAEPNIWVLSSCALYSIKESFLTLLFLPPQILMSASLLRVPLVLPAWMRSTGIDACAHQTGQDPTVKKV